MNHTNNLLRYIPDLKSRKTLDLGCGYGYTLKEFSENGFSDLTGIDTEDSYLEETRKKVSDNVKVLKASGEKLPFTNETFGFINMSELIEHVNNPSLVLMEVKRVLKNDGVAYISVPNRFSLRDPHYKIYFINYLPRFASDYIINLLGKNKDNKFNNGLQKLSEMHYMTRSSFIRFARDIGFKVDDTRVLKIRNKLPKGLRSLGIFAYILLSYLYIDSFHFILKK